MILVGDYELLEPISAGQVESFFARHLRTNAQVVIHVFTAPESCHGDNALRKYLSELVPAPPGLVTGTGRRPNTPYAYVVTTMPPLTALTSWVKECEKRVSSPGGVPAEAVTNQPIEPAPAPVAPASAFGAPLGEARLGPVPPVVEAPSANVAPTGDFTSFFQRLGTVPEQPKSPEISGTSKGPNDSGVMYVPPPTLTPSNDELLNKTEIDIFSANAGAPMKAEPPRAESFTQLFNVSPVAQTPSAGGSGKDRGGTGEFTSFFRSPMASPAPKPDSMAFPDVSTARGHVQEAGDFTQMFGRPDAAAPPASSSASFDAMLLESAGESRGPVPQVDPASGNSFLTGSTAAPVFDNPQPPKPNAVQEPIAGTSARRPDASDASVLSAGPTGATNVFSQPAIDAGPIITGPTGPSEYTRILNRSAFFPEPPKSAPIPEPSAAVAMPGSLNVPSPVSVTPPQVQAPSVSMQPVSMAAPAVPTIPQPQVQLPAVQAPKAGAGKAASYWPLIAGLMGLVALALLLVMYFALKH